MTSSDSGVLVIDKPQGMTSHDVVSVIRKKFGTKKVGHAGTLDPMATGVLVVGVNSATRLLDFIVAGTKEYEATVRLGQSTISDDKDGEVVETISAKNLTDEQIQNSLMKNLGVISQIPAKVSSKKVNGKRAHALVRAGVEFELKPKEVQIFDLQIISISRVDDFVDVKIKVTCSPGTYIRSIARDMGQDLKVGGHLTTLRRTKVAAFDIATAQVLDSQLQLIDLFTSVTSVLPTFEADANLANQIRFGKPLAKNLLPASGVFAVTHKNQVLALISQTDEGDASYRAVLATEIAD